MKRIFSILLTILIISCSIIGLCACEDNEEGLLVVGDNGKLYYKDYVYECYDWIYDEFSINYEYQNTKHLDSVRLPDESYKNYSMNVMYFAEDTGINLLYCVKKIYLKEGFELIDKYDATITAANIKNINRELNADITLPTNLTLKDIIDVENKIESIPQEVPYYFIDMRVEEYSYLCIYEVLRVYNGEVYINLTPSREDNTRYNYPIKEEYKTYFTSVIEWNNNI